MTDSIKGWVVRSIVPLVLFAMFCVAACSDGARDTRDIDVSDTPDGMRNASGEELDGDAGGESAAGSTARILGRFEAACGGQKPSPERAADPDQYTAGLAAFSENCASCHGGSGSFAGGLSTDVLRRYRTAFGLYDYIRLSMPYYEAGTLAPQEYWDITAFLIISTGLAEPDVRVGCGGLPDVVFAQAR